MRNRPAHHQKFTDKYLVCYLHPVLVQAMIAPTPTDFCHRQYSNHNWQLSRPLAPNLFSKLKALPKVSKPSANQPSPASSMISRATAFSKLATPMTSHPQKPSSTTSSPPPPPPTKRKHQPCEKHCVYILATHTSKAHWLIGSTWPGQWRCFTMCSQNHSPLPCTHKLPMFIINLKSETSLHWIKHHQPSTKRKIS